MSVGKADCQLGAPSPPPSAGTKSFEPPFAAWSSAKTSSHLEYTAPIP